jgi:hypothetical protein
VLRFDLAPAFRAFTIGDVGWERELQLLERAIQRVNAEYDAFLYGAASKPPTGSRKTVDEMLRRLTAGDIESAAERYRLATLQGRYTALCERWERLQSEKEAGRRPGVYGGFARDSKHIAVPPASPPPHNSPNAAYRSSVSARKAPVERDLFDRYVAAKKARGEEMAGYDFNRFVEGLDRERAKLKERFGDVAVEFDVTDRDGRVRLVARKKNP